MINSLRNFGLAGNSRVLPDIGVLSRNYQKISNLNFSQTFRSLRALACEIYPTYLENFGRLSFSGIIEFKFTFIVLSHWRCPLTTCRSRRSSKPSRHGSTRLRSRSTRSRRPQWITCSTDSRWSKAARPNKECLEKMN